LVSKLVTDAAGAWLCGGGGGEARPDGDKWDTRPPEARGVSCVKRSPGIMWLRERTSKIRLNDDS